jgi:SAM-dependent methyltransferase
MKRDWTDGYVSDINYSFGYYQELAPSFIQFSLLLNGFSPPATQGKYSYCELGFGHGVSANIFAAANPRGEFWGTDFNPDHALFANELAKAADISAHWMDSSFEEFLDLETPQFDFITLHGVWSWISPSAQNSIVEILRRKLKVGGAVFLSYNVLPGWGAEMPLRELLRLHTEYASPKGISTSQKISKALNFAQALSECGATYFTDHQQAKNQLQDMLSSDSSYLAHEYFNRSWAPTYFADLAATLEKAKLTFACSLHASDLLGEFRHKPQFDGLLEKTDSNLLRETVNDYALNRRFRRDVFIRGAKRLCEQEKNAQLLELRYLPVKTTSEISLNAKTPYGSFALSDTIYKPVINAFKSIKTPITLHELRKNIDVAALNINDLIEVIGVMVARQDIQPIFEEEFQGTKNKCEKLNKVIAENARYYNDVKYLSSPVTGKAVDANRFELLFWLAWQEGNRTPSDLALRGWEFFLELGQPMVTAQGVLNNINDSLDAFKNNANQFVETVAPLWISLGILKQESNSNT